MARKSLTFVALAYLAAVAATPASGQIIPAGDPVGGQSQLSLADQWWPWVMQQSVATNPLLDPTGAHAAGGDRGSVFYLAGSVSPNPVFRSVTVPAGKPLFFPLVNVFADNTALPGDPPTHATAAELLAFFAQAFDPAAVQLFTEIDGAAQTGLLGHRLTTDPAHPFSYTTTSPDNFLDTVLGGDSTLGTGVYPSTVSPVIQDGYWLALQPFAPGSTHTLHFGGTTGISAQDITYTVTTAPEPAAAGVLLCALLPALAARRRRA